MKAVITGATGLLGGNLALILIARGVDVVCTRRATSRIDHLGDASVHWVEADVTDVDALVRAFAGADVVFHCAAAVSTLRTVTPTLQRTNIDGTRNVLDAVRQVQASREHALRLVHCSSTVACALSTTGEPVTEAEAWNFDQYGIADGYTTTKYQSQILVEQAAGDDIDAVIVNPGYMFGPYDVKPSSGALIVNIVKGKVPGYTTGYNSFVDVRDVARGMIAAWERGKRGERYILGGRNASYREIMETIARVAGVRPPRRAVPRPLASALGWLGEAYQAVSGREAFINITRVRYGFCERFIVSSAKAERELDYRLSPVETAIADAFDWFRQNGML